MLPPKAGYIERDGEYVPTELTQMMLDQQYALEILQGGHDDELDDLISRNRTEETA